MVGHDLRYALRTLARNPGFAFVSILALALGIGANSAIFTVVNSVLLEPMHFFQAKQLVVVRERNLEAGFPEFSLSPGNYLSYRDENHSFSGIAASRRWQRELRRRARARTAESRAGNLEFLRRASRAADAGTSLHQRGKRAGRRPCGDPQLRLVAAPLRRAQ